MFRLSDFVSGCQTRVGCAHPLLVSQLGSYGVSGRTALGTVFLYWSSANQVHLNAHHLGPWLLSRPFLYLMLSLGAMLTWDRPCFTVSCP